jgi:hypothetical protein
MASPGKVPMIMPTNAPFDESRASRAGIVVLSPVVDRDKPCIGYMKYIQRKTIERMMVV